jgi:hypothetical protein
VRVTPYVRRWSLVFLFGAVAAFISPYVAPREMPMIERAAVFVALFGTAFLLALALDLLIGWLLRRTRGADPPPQP